MKKSIVLLAALGLGALAAAPAKADTLVVQMLGASDIVGDAGEIDAREGTGIDFDGLGVTAADFLCFEMPLVDAATNNPLGTGVDCLRWDEPGLIFGGADALTEEDNVTDGTMTVTVFSFFNMHGGTIVNFGKTTIQPFVSGFGDGFPGGDDRNTQVTHMTGSIPTPLPDGHSIVAATGVFSGVWGNARVSGAVSVLSIDPDNLKGPTFDCLWEINLDLDLFPGGLRNAKDHNPF